MKGKLTDLNKLVTDMILKDVPEIEGLERHSPFWHHVLPNESTPIMISINRKSIDKEIIRCVKELALFHEVLDADLFTVRLAVVIENILSLIDTGEEGEE